MTLKFFRGLDDLSSAQCITMLKTLATGGRTVICSIHTPSARLFQLFDHVYIVSQGQCVYQGAATEIVQFLASIGLSCPTHYNPADFSKLNLQFLSSLNLYNHSNLHINCIFYIFCSKCILTLYVYIK